jgi:hypothetical protein
MKRIAVLLAVALATFIGTTSIPSQATATHATSAGVRPAGEEAYSLCQARPFMCLDPYHNIGEDGSYTGHDEPTVQFSSHRPGTGGRRLLYYVQLPKDPPKAPKQDGSGGTWNFQLRATFWFSITMCDTESSPNFRNTCRPNSDRNAKFRSNNPRSPWYIGKSPGNAFMELQFYAPGWVPQFDGFGCTATQWCANLTIDSLSDQDNTGISQNADCLENHFLVGEEPINWAYITKNGESQAPANPLALSDDPSLAGLVPNPHKTLFMNGGDKLKVYMHDTRIGYRIDIWDLTTGKHGSMTASKANGFGQVLFQPHAQHCHVRPYAFHPMYDSAVKRGSTWGAHTTNVGASDEIGHFEYCDAADPTTFACTDPGGHDSTLDDDDQFCLDGSNYAGAQPIIGCLLDDGDFDGPSYVHDWPGSFKNPRHDRRYHETPFRFTAPSSDGRLLEHVAFETDLPRIERGEPANHQPECDRDTGEHCVNPPVGARFYPIYTVANGGGRCWFQQGDVHIPGTIRRFGGSSATEYGTKVLFVHYADVGFKVIRLAEDFHRDLPSNPCGS